MPQDVAVVGFDDIDLARHASPPLTTIRQPAAYQAQRMIDVLLARLEGVSGQRGSNSRWIWWCASRSDRGRLALRGAACGRPGSGGDVSQTGSDEAL